MTEEQGFLNLFRVAEGKQKHPLYKRTCELAIEYRAFVTGDGLDKFLRQFVRRESEELFEQRKRITQHVSTSVLDAIMSAFRKAHRAARTRVLEYAGGEGDAKKAALEMILGEFTADMGVDDWVYTRVLELNETDPNALIVLEWEPFDFKRQNAKPYPFEVHSEDALDYKRDQRGELLYLIARAPGAFGGERLTLYMKNASFSLDEVKVKGTQAPPPGTRKIGQKYWLFTEHPPHGLGYVPAFRVGYKRDPLTGGNSFVAPYQPAMPILHKQLKANSELDLTRSLHAHPLVVRVGEPCDAQGCYGGKVYGEGGEHVCGTCQGTGYKKRPTTTQEEIVVTPAKTGDLPDIERTILYKTPPVEFLQWMDGHVERLTEQAKRAVFNAEIFTQTQVAKTATGENLDMDAVYDTLYPYMLKIAQVWNFVVKGVADITDKSAGLTANMLIRRDGRLKGFDALLEDWRKANETGAGPLVKRRIEADIANAMFADEPEKYQQWQTRERYNPFSGQSEGQIMYLLASDLVPKEQKVLYSNLGYIFDNVEKARPDFYSLARKDQDALVNAVVSDIVAGLDNGVQAIADGPDRLGKIPLALQQLGLARARTVEVGDKKSAKQMGDKIGELLDQL